MKKIILLLFFLAITSYGQYKSVWDAVPDVIKEKNSFQRYEWFYRSRSNEEGVFPNEHILKEKIKEEKLAASIKGTGFTWTPIGPVGINMSNSFIPYWGVNSGRARGLDIDPANPNIVYIGAAAGGIWKTTNGGTSWSDVSQGLSTLTFGAIAIDPNNTNIIYAGTGEARWLFNTTTFEGNGLYKSIDGGTSWTQITNGFGSKTQFSDIQVNPHNSNILLASLGSGNWSYGNLANEGVWMSTNAGVNWTKVINQGDAFEVAFHPTDPNIYYAATGNQNVSGGFFISTNAGANWSQSNTGLPAANTIGRIQFAVAASSPSTLYALIYNSAALSGGYTTAAFKSVNGGVNWSQISSGVNIAGTYDGTNVSDQGSYDLCLAISPTSSSSVLFGNVEVSRTTDGSTISFVRNPSGYNGGVGAWAGYIHTDIHCIKYAPSDANIVYVTCDGGVYKSVDGGASFSHVNNGINSIQFYSVASHPTNPNILFGGAQDNGNFSTQNKGATSWVFETSGDGMNCFVDYNNPNNVFMSTQNGSLYRSSDGGVNWYDAYSLSTNTAWVAPYWQHPTQPAKIYAALNQRIYMSTNYGVNWSAISPAITTNRITATAHSPVNTNKLMAVASRYTTSPGIYRSIDEGYTWMDITANVTGSGFSGAMIQNVIADPVNENIFYIVRASYGTGQVIKTVDFGNTWTSITGNLPAISANDLFIDPANTNHLYAGNDFGVYWSSNGGTNWQKLNDNMPFLPVLDFSFFNYGGTRLLRAATHGRGIYELSIDEPLPVELESFTAQVTGGNIMLKWTTASEVNNYGFDVEKSSDKISFSKIGYVAGAGNSNSPKEYLFIDEKTTAKVYYRLKQIDTDGKTSYSKVISTDALQLTDFALSQNYPNPFNPATRIEFTIPVNNAGGENGIPVQLKLYNTLGVEVAELVNENKKPGRYEVTFNGSSLASGVYFYKLTAGSFELTKKMILAK